MKHKKHTKIVKDFDQQKAIHLEKLANKMLKDDEKNRKLNYIIQKGTHATWIFNRDFANVIYSWFTEDKLVRKICE